MTQTIRNEAIRYRNEAFAIHHLIAVRDVRKLPRNAVYNAALLLSTE